MTEKCIICLIEYNNMLYQSDCKCVYVCKPCLKLIDLTMQSHAYGHVRKRVIYCSLNCIYSDFDYKIDVGRMFDTDLLINHTYYFLINKHQQRILDHYEYKKCYSQLDNYFIPDLTKIICDYLIEK